MLGAFLFLPCVMLTAAAGDELLDLQEKLARQEEQIAELRSAVAEQRKIIDRLIAQRGDSTPPVKSASEIAQSQQAAPPVSPLQFGIGTTSITPIGFVDLIQVLRNRNVASGIGTNFANIPLSNTVQGKLGENRLSAQNSRLGLRLDTAVAGWNVLGYMEGDFLGTAPGNLTVTSNSNTYRMRLYFLDARKEKWEALFGQSWSLLTPNRKGLSSLPGDVFFTQNVDTNYHVGLVWTRSPQWRVLYHPNPGVAVGVSFEGGEQYAGGSGGSGTIVLPSQLQTAYSVQLNSGGSTTGTPNPGADVVVKAAFDGTPGDRAVHFELGGAVTRYRFYNPLSDHHFRIAGGALTANFNAEVVRNLRMVANTLYSSGGGRYLFGLGPDLIIRPDGSPSLVRALSTLGGFEWQTDPNTAIYSYYGGVYLGRNTDTDPATQTPIGYGFTGAPSNHNRTIQEISLGLTKTFFRSPDYGAMQFMAQYGYAFRNPWSQPAGTPRSANVNIIFLDLRYTLPGASPAAK